MTMPEGKSPVRNDEYIRLMREARDAAINRLNRMGRNVEKMQTRYTAVLREILDRCEAGTGDPQVMLLSIARLAKVAHESACTRGAPWMICGKLLADREVTGVCPVCQINLYGAKPRPKAMPCGLPNCPHEKHDPKKRAQDEQMFSDLASSLGGDDATFSTGNQLPRRPHS